MVTKRGPIVKQLAKALQRWPPENFAPWKTPNKRLQKIIDSQISGKLESSMAGTQAALFSRFMSRKLKN